MNSRAPPHVPPNHKPSTSHATPLMIGSSPKQKSKQTGLTPQTISSRPLEPFVRIHKKGEPFSEFEICTMQKLSHSSTRIINNHHRICAIPSQSHIIRGKMRPGGDARLFPGIGKTLITTYTIAVCKGRFRTLWNGFLRSCCCPITRNIARMQYCPGSLGCILQASAPPMPSCG